MRLIAAARALHALADLARSSCDRLDTYCSSKSCCSGLCSATNRGERPYRANDVYYDDQGNMIGPALERCSNELGPLVLVPTRPWRLGSAPRMGKATLMPPVCCS